MDEENKISRFLELSTQDIYDRSCRMFKRMDIPCVEYMADYFHKEYGKMYEYEEGYQRKMVKLCDILLEECYAYRKFELSAIILVEGKFHHRYMRFYQRESQLRNIESLRRYTQNTLTIMHEMFPTKCIDEVLKKYDYKIEKRRKSIVD